MQLRASVKLRSTNMVLRKRSRISFRLFNFVPFTFQG
jgi:hypothetical protein